MAGHERAIHLFERSMIPLPAIAGQTRQHALRWQHAISPAGRRRRRPKASTAPLRGLEVEHDRRCRADALEFIERVDGKAEAHAAFAGEAAKTDVLRPDFDAEAVEFVRSSPISVLTHW